MLIGLLADNYPVCQLHANKNMIEIYRIKSETKTLPSTGVRDAIILQRDSFRRFFIISDTNYPPRRVQYLSFKPVEPIIPTKKRHLGFRGHLVVRSS